MAQVLPLILLLFPAGGVPIAGRGGVYARCVASYRIAHVHTIAVGRNPTALAVDARTRRAFVRNGDGTVSVLDLTRDRLLRTVTVSRPDAYPTGNAASIAVDERTGRVFVSMGNAIHVLDATTGTPLRTVARGSAPGAVAVDEAADRVFVLTNFNEVSMLDARTGALLRTTHLGGNPSGLVVDQRTKRVFVAATNFVKVLDATSDSLLRTVSGVAPGEAHIAVDAATGRVFLAGFSGGLYIPTPRGGGALVKGVSVLDARDGRLRRSLGAAQGYHNASVGSLVVDELAGRVLAVGGSVSVLDARSGAVLLNRRLPRQRPGGQAGPAAVGAHGAGLFVPISYEEPAAQPQSGAVSVVDVATARVVTTIPIGGLLLSATVDPTTGRVLILDRNDPAHPGSPRGSVSVLAAPPCGRGSGA